MTQLVATPFEPVRETEEAPSRPLEPEPPGHRHLRKSWIALAISVVIVVATLTLLGTLLIQSVGVVGFSVAALVAFVGAGRSVAALVRSLGPSSRMSGLSIFGAVVALFGNLFMVLVGSAAAFLSTGQFTRGRQLRRRGRVLLAAVEPGGGWVPPVALPRVEAPLCVAAQWRENGRTEHASVAAFARLTLDLLALGAPSGLVADAQRDALDEIRHTELCFDLARSMDGSVASPAPFPEAAHARTLPAERTLALALLAVDSLVDGALNEGVSARIVARLARRVSDPTIRSVLLEIAADEGRHAAHGWDVVLYCLAEGGEPVRRALQGAIHALPERMRPSVDRAAQSGDWERWGIPGAALEDAEFQKTRADIQRRVRKLIEPRAA